MTIRAKRLIRYLEEVCGWETGWSGKYECRKCGDWSFSRTNYCPKCGAKMPTKQAQTDTPEQVEAAIAYALGETRSIKR